MLIRNFRSLVTKLNMFILQTSQCHPSKFAHLHRYLGKDNTVKKTNATSITATMAEPHVSSIFNWQ